MNRLPALVGVLVAAAIYPDAVVRAGIARTLAAVDPSASGISVTIDVRQPDAATFDALRKASEDLEDCIEGVSVGAAA